MQTQLGNIQRTFAAVLALVWGVAGLLALLAGGAYGRWGPVLGGIFGLWYGAVWARVAHTGRYLTFREMATPWKAPSSQ